MQPRLDHLIGRGVDKATKKTLTMGDDYKLIQGGDEPWPKDLVGQVFVAVEDMGPNVRLLFTEDDAIVGKGNLKISRHDESFDPFEVVDPNVDLPPDPSPDRIKEGPEEGHEDEAGTGEAEQGSEPSQ